MGGDGGGGEAVDYSAAELPVEFGTEVVMSAAGDGDDAFEDMIVGGTGGGDGDQRRPDEEVIDIIWTNSDVERS